VDGIDHQTERASREQAAATRSVTTGTNKERRPVMVVETS
jgi:hypothetical protein